jgi:hypothetical protein
MKKLIVLTGAFVLMSGVSGCGSNTHEELIKKMIANVKATGDVLDRIKREAKDAKVDGKKIKKIGEDVVRKEGKNLAKIGEQFSELKKQARALKESLSEDEKKNLANRYKEELQDAIVKTSQKWDAVKDIYVGEKVVENEGSSEEKRIKKKIYVKDVLTERGVDALKYFSSGD